jgi:hypothetical protein
MHKTLLVFVAGLALSVSGAGMAEPSDQANTSAAAAATSEPMAQTVTAVPGPEHIDSQAAGMATRVSAKGEKVICHHPVHEGTIMPKEVCLTQNSWDTIRLREEKHVKDMQMQGYRAPVR